MLPNFLSSSMSKTQPNNPKILSEHIITLSESRSKQQIMNQLNKVDEQIYQIYDGYHVQAGSPRKTTGFDGFGLKNSVLAAEFYAGDTPPGFLASTFNNTTSVSLGVPKNNSLTDSFLRTTLGCQQKLAKSYLQIMDQSDTSQRDKRIQDAKKRFAQSNNFKDIYANGKPFMDKVIAKSYIKRTQPVIDNEHDAYLKTQMIYLQKPILGKKLSQKQYYDKHADNVAKKINEIGGMQDTVGNMQDSLSKNQIKNFTKRSHFMGNTGPNPYKKDNKSLSKRPPSKQSGNSWVDRSKSIRQALMTKFDIQ